MNLYIWGIYIQSEVWNIYKKTKVLCFIFSSSRLHLFDQNYSKTVYCEILLQFKIAIFYLYTNILKLNLFMWSKLNFQNLSRSFRNYSNILIYCSIIVAQLLIMVLIIINVKNCFCWLIFSANTFFRILWWIEHFKTVMFPSTVSIKHKNNS